VTAVDILPRVNTRESHGTSPESGRVRRSLRRRGQRGRRRYLTDAVDDCHSITSVRTASRLESTAGRTAVIRPRRRRWSPRRVPIGSALGDSYRRGSVGGVERRLEDGRSLDVLLRSFERSSRTVLESAASVGSRIAARILGPSTWGNRNQSTEPFGATSSRRRSQRPPIAISRVSEPEWAAVRWRRVRDTCLPRRRRRVLPNDVRILAASRSRPRCPPGPGYRACGRRQREIHAGPCRPAHEEIGTYDATYYETQLVRAVESALSPLGRDRTDIHRELAETQEMAVTAFTSVGGK